MAVSPRRGVFPPRDERKTKMKRTFKRILSAVLLVCVLCGLLLSAFAAAPGGGDADNDGTVTAADARFALRISVKLETPDAETESACDMDGDGAVTAADARMILRKAVGLPPDGPDEPEEPEKPDRITEADLPADAKILYLTFDDGPSANTIKILDILDRYNVKATFFVVWNSQYAYLYKEIVDRGHTIALHSYTHDYSKIYTGTTAYFNDLNKLSDAVYARTGVRSKLIRFPGGSSNTVSKRYCAGIMSTLTKEVEKRGYVYFDWNVDSCDADGKSHTAAELTRYATNTKQQRVVLLHHDAASKRTTVESLPKTIETYLARGYYIIGLTEQSYTAHHRVNN